MIMTFMKTMKWLGVAAAAVTLLVAGCKSSSEGTKIPPTESGFPEVALPAKPVEQIQAITQAFFKNRGYTERDSRHAYQQVFDKPATSGKPDKALRVVLRLQQEKNGTWRLVGSPMGVEGWHSALESAVVVPQGKAQVQGFLDQIKAQVEAAP